MIDEISLSVDEFVFVLFCLRLMQLKTYQLSMPRINRLTCLACLEGKYIVGKKKKRVQHEDFPGGHPS